MMPHLALSIPLYERTATPSEIINLTQEDLKTIPSQTDFLIIKTGFGQYRGQQKSPSNPGLSQAQMY